MKVLVVGGGGREHALCWKIAQSPLVRELVCAPGNAGTAKVARNVPIAGGEVAKLVNLAVHEQCDLVVVGPEEPLCLGLAGPFVLDVVVYSDALLFRALDPHLWAARGFAYALAIPLLGLASSAIFQDLILRKRRKDREPGGKGTQQDPWPSVYIFQWFWLCNVSETPPSGCSLREAKIRHFEVGPLHNNLEKECE